MSKVFWAHLDSMKWGYFSLNPQAFNGIYRDFMCVPSIGKQKGLWKCRSEKYELEEGDNTIVTIVLICLWTFVGQDEEIVKVYWGPSGNVSEGARMRLLSVDLTFRNFIQGISDLLWVWNDPDEDQSPK